MPKHALGNAYFNSLLVGFLHNGIQVHWVGPLGKSLWNFMDQASVDQAVASKRLLVSAVDKRRSIMQSVDMVVVPVAHFARADDAEQSELLDHLDIESIRSRTVCIDHSDNVQRDYRFPPFDGLAVRLITAREVGKNTPHVWPFDPMAAHSLWSRDVPHSHFVSCLFSAGGAASDRKQMREEVITALQTAYPEALSSRLSRDQYYRRMSASMISVSHWGLGYSCKRDWEILACGAILAHRPGPNPHLDHFADMHSAIEYASADQLVEKLDWLRHRPAMLRQLAQRSRHIVDQHHRPQHRAHALCERFNRALSDEQWVCVGQA